MDTRQQRYPIEFLGYVLVAAGFGFLFVNIRAAILTDYTTLIAHYAALGGHHVTLIAIFVTLIVRGVAAALGLYLIYIGRRRVNFALLGQAGPEARFGWGRIVIGTFVLCCGLTQRFGLSPTWTWKFEPGEPPNPNNPGNGLVPVLYGLVAIWMLSGIWQGFRRRAAKPDTGC